MRNQFSLTIVQPYARQCLLFSAIFLLMPPILIFIVGAVAGFFAQPSLKSFRSSANDYFTSQADLNRTMASIKEDLQDLKAEFARTKQDTK